MGNKHQVLFCSVIVPVYNVALYLGECLDSILAQTYGGWQCLCTDDGSKDGSAEILDDYARSDVRFHIVHQPNAGVSAARNRALDRAQGQWICFVDGDDAIHPNTLNILHDTAVKFPKTPAIRFLAAEKRWLPLRLDAIAQRKGWWILTPTHSKYYVLYRRLLCKNLRFQDYIVGEHFCTSLLFDVQGLDRDLIAALLLPPS